MPSYQPKVPEGQHLGTSRKDGETIGHLFDDETGKLVGHATWVEVDDDGDDGYVPYEPEPDRPLTKEEIEAAAELAALIVGALIAATTWAAPRVARWWETKVRPGLRRLTKRRSVHDGADLQMAVEPKVFVVSADGVELEVAQSRVTMSAREWQARMEALLAAEAFSDEQRRILSQAQIVEDGRALGTGRLTPQEVAERIAKALAASPVAQTPEGLSMMMDAVERAQRPEDEPPALAATR